MTWIKNKAHCKALHCVLEATGVYHDIAALELYQAGTRVSVINRAHSKHFAKSLGISTKNDHSDAKVLAQYGLKMQDSLRLWQPPSSAYQALRYLESRKYALQKDLQREQNRLEKHQFNQASPQAIASIERMITHLTTELEWIEQQLEAHSESDEALKRNRGVLCAIQGISNGCSAVLLPVFGHNHFKNAKQAATYLGLIPLEYQSGNSVNKPARLSKAGLSQIRRKLYMVATRFNPVIKDFYNRLEQKAKAKKSALLASMRTLVHLCFGVLKTQTPFSINHA